jgi:hypothetical protein
LAAQRAHERAAARVPQARVAVEARGDEARVARLLPPERCTRQTAHHHHG